MKCLSWLVLATLCGCAHTGQPAGRPEKGIQPVARLDLHPVRLDGQKQLAYLVAELTINGQSGRFMVDTGASNGWVHPDFARRLGMTIVAGKVDNIGAGGRSPQKGHVASYDLGFAKVGDLFFLVGDLFEYANRQLPARQRIDGLIGLDMLTRFSAEIDVGSQTMIFFKPPR